MSRHPPRDPSSDAGGEGGPTRNCRVSSRLVGKRGPRIVSLVGMGQARTWRCQTSARAVSGRFDYEEERYARRNGLLKSGSKRQCGPSNHAYVKWGSLSDVTLVWGDIGEARMVGELPAWLVPFGRPADGRLCGR